MNSNAVMVTDHTGAVFIVLGKGIGYGVRPGDQIDTNLITETFVPDANNPIDQLAEFLAETPIEYVDVSRAIVDAASAQVQLRAAQSLLLSLADHIYFAIQRANDGVVFQYPLRWEVTQLYPQEVALGRVGLEIVRARLGTTLPDEEAVPLAMHLVNAQFSGSGLNPTIEMTRRIGDVLTTIEEQLTVTLDRNGMNVARFVTHLRYLFVRIENNQLLDSTDQAMIEAVATARPVAYRGAQAVRSVLEKNGKSISAEEVLYLALHIDRLTRGPSTRRKGE
ncbi:PRD domain-containing protein [Arthrobacter sp. HY1533]|uniref:PRD domain-containing protein n=1 Tax=Arthrobacter sp. HY1533 TaxID=2970919 RepID=UPI0022BA078A|nr:PRD domain-containing protein [Arthrobacter sp. HY1533]